MHGKNINIYVFNITHWEAVFVLPCLPLKRPGFMLSIPSGGCSFHKCVWFLVGGFCMTLGAGDLNAKPSRWAPETR